MLKTWAKRYYAEDEFDEELLSQIRSCRQKALPREIEDVLSENHWLHDWYVRGISVYCSKRKKFCRIALFKHSKTSRFNFQAYNRFQLSANGCPLRQNIRIPQMAIRLHRFWNCVSILMTPLNALSCSIMRVIL